MNERFGERQVFQNPEEDNANPNEGSEAIQPTLEKTPKEIVAIIKEKYQCDEDLFTLKQQLDNINKAFGGLENIRGKRILDIGCGHTLDAQTKPIIQAMEASKDYSNMHRLESAGAYDSLIAGDINKRTFEPWLCRALVEIGAQPVGIDIGNLEGEQFEHYQMDLSKPGSLDVFPDHSFDGVHSRLFFSSPQLERMVSKQGIQGMQEELQMQTQRILKQDGKVLSRELAPIDKDT